MIKNNDNTIVVFEINSMSCFVFFVVVVEYTRNLLAHLRTHTHTHNHTHSRRFLVK